MPDDFVLCIVLCTGRPRPSPATAIVRGTSISIMAMSTGMAKTSAATSGWCAADSEFGRVAALFFRVEARGERLKAKAHPRDAVFTPSQRLLLHPAEIDRDAHAAQRYGRGRCPARQPWIGDEYMIRSARKRNRRTDYG